MAAERSSEAITDLTVYFTAAEAYPAFERLCVAAQRSIRAGFHVFDLTTQLRSDEARAVGETWFDLFLYCLERGVEIDITVTDFDPIIATDLHMQSWATARQLAGLSEIASKGRLRYHIAMHPARVGTLPRMALQGKVRAELEDTDQTPLTPGLPDSETEDSLSLVPATHHQKLAVVDGTDLYIGGLDLNERRFDTPKHDRPAEDTWKDIQAVARGSVAKAAETHLKHFVAVTEGEEAPPETQPGFLRTLSSKRDMPLLHISPKPLVTELEEAHLQAVHRARGLMYLETQFFRHRPLAEALAEAAARQDDLALVLVLPAAPEDVAFHGNARQDAQLGAQKQLDALRIITDGFGPRLALGAPAQCRRAPAKLDAAATHFDAPIIYVHSKLSLFSDTEAILSSANLNGRSMRWDTEAGLHITQPSQIRPIWPRALGHWLQGEAPQTPLKHPPPDVVAEINAVMDQDRNRPPEARRQHLLPFDMGRAEDLARPLPGVPDEMV